MTKTHGRVLLIFIKNPRKGNVKTRLAATLGDEKALSIYQKLLAYTRKVAALVSAERQVWYSRFIPPVDAWSEDGFSQKLQSGQSLGQRMKNAFSQAFEEGFAKAVIIGSDCAQLTSGHIERAFEALESNDIAIGPSQDGGYYLLGMNRFLPRLFEDKSWSTQHVFSQTIDDCKKLGYRYQVLQELNDVDTEADWQQVKDQFK